MADRKRAKAILVQMRDRDWADLDDLVELSSAPNMSEAMRAGARERLQRLRREEAHRQQQALAMQSTIGMSPQEAAKWLEDDRAKKARLDAATDITRPEPQQEAS